MKIKDPSTMPEFGRNIQQLRKAKKLKQSELAEEIGLSRELISYYESRCQNPTTEIVKKFAEYFSKKTADQNRRALLSKFPDLHMYYENLNKL